MAREGEGRAPYQFKLDTSHAYQIQESGKATVRVPATEPVAEGQIVSIVLPSEQSPRNARVTSIQRATSDETMLVQIKVITGLTVVK
jgi:hypothetical protein